MQVVNQSAELLSVTPESARLIESAGRTCYQSTGNPESTAPFIAMLMRRGHLSVLEHASATIRIVTDRGVTHELVRHRIAAYSQESTRYCNYRDSIRFIAPVDFDLDDADRILLAAIERHYSRCLARGRTPQQARYFLPNGLKTEIVMTCNFREWLHVLSLREAPATHPQMRALMVLVRAELVKACPEVFNERA
ncbi:MAG: FAD-dependent thymidylate synthase [Thermoleophilia bacterium]